MWVKYNVSLFDIGTHRLNSRVGHTNKSCWYIWQLSLSYLAVILQLYLSYIAVISQLYRSYLVFISQLSLSYIPLSHIYLTVIFKDISQLSHSYLAVISQVSFSYLTVMSQLSYTYIAGIFQLYPNYISVSGISQLSYSYHAVILQLSHSYLAVISQLSCYNLSVSHINLTVICSNLTVISHFSCRTSRLLQFPVCLYLFIRWYHQKHQHSNTNSGGIQPCLPADG